ncbi:hypothetical protein GCM10010423_65440 [Streptomyces levis]|uniref:Uncharacterized protein n=1 Tax=Streptomyces levis TaxID=285566 RepID=A0ABN3P622_9ACTN
MNNEINITGQETDERGDFFRCPCCKKESFHPEDRKQGYCAACRFFTGDNLLTPFGKCPHHINRTD